MVVLPRGTELALAVEAPRADPGSSTRTEPADNVRRASGAADAVEVLVPPALLPSVPMMLLLVDVLIVLTGMGIAGLALDGLMDIYERSNGRG